MSYPKGFVGLDYPARVADEYVSVPDVNDPDAFAARVVGDSMAPQYTEGDIIVFSPMAEPRDGDDCFVRLADGETFKRVHFEADGMVRLQPLNERFASRTVAMADIIACFPSVMVMRSTRRD